MSNKTIIYTDGGSVSYRGLYYGGWGFSGKSEDKSFYGYGACKTKFATNNHAELEAYVKASQYVIKNKIKDVTFKLDSKYVLDGANKYLPLWEKNDWKTRQGLPVKNKQMWLSVKTIRNEMDDNNISHNYEWVKGHSGVEGNELADKGATTGIALAKLGNYKPVYGYDDIELDKEAKKAKVSVPRLLCLRRLLCVTGSELPYREKSEHFVYYQTNFDDKKNVRAKYCGRQGADVIESVYLSKAKIDAIHDVHALLSKNVGKDVLIPGIVQLDKVLSKKNLGDITVKGDNVLGAIGDDIMLNGDTLVAYPIKVPLMTLCAFNSMNAKFTLLECYLDDKQKGNNEYDVTDTFFTTDAKGKQKLRADVAKQTAFKFNFKLKQGTARTALMPNVNFPQLVKLAGAAKEDGGVKVYIILHNISDMTFQYSFIVETGNGDVALFDSPESNLRLFSKK